MARIPTYSSQVSPGVGTSLSLPRANADMFGAQVGDALQRTGHMMARRAAEKQQREENAGLTSAALAFETFNADFAESRRKARETAVADGAGHEDALLADFDTRTGALLRGAQGERAKQWLQLQVARMRGGVRVQEGGFATGLRAGKVALDYQGSRDLAANALFTLPSRKALDETVLGHDALVDALELPADAKGKIKAENLQLFAVQYARGLRESDPYALRAELDKGELNGMLGPDQLASLRTGVDTEIRGREAQVRMEQNQRRAEQKAAEAEARRAQRDAIEAAKDMARDMAAGLAAGVHYSPAEIASVAGAAARMPGGQALARNITLLGEKNATAIELRGATPRQVQDSINLLTHELAKGGANAPVLAARLDAARDAQSAQKSQLAADPLSYATTQGVVRLLPLNPGDPLSVRARVTAARAVKARYGGPLTVLTDEEVGEYQGRLNGADAPTRYQALREISAMGGEGAAAAMRQIGKGNPVTARAGALMGGTAGGATTARTILQGSDVLKQKPLPKAEAEIRYFAATETVGRSLRFLPELRDQIPATSMAYYAGWQQQAGQDGFDGDNFGQAVNAAAGGVRGRDGQMRGGLGTRNGVGVLLPDGKTQGEFDAAFTALDVAKWPAAQRPMWGPGKPVTDAQLRAARPFAVGGGRYVLATDRAGDKLIMAADGKPFTVQIK